MHKNKINAVKKSCGSYNNQSSSEWFSNFADKYLTSSQSEKFKEIWPCKKMQDL